MNLENLPSQIIVRVAVICANPRKILPSKFLMIGNLQNFYSSKIYSYTVFTTMTSSRLKLIYHRQNTEAL